MIKQEHSLFDVEDGTKIVVEFIDTETEVTILEAITTVIGDHDAAILYLPTFVKDLERNFPQIKNETLEMPITEEEMI